MKKRLVSAGVRTCFATFTDVYGIPKAKATPIDSFEHMCEGSGHIGAGSDITGPQPPHLLEIQLSTCCSRPTADEWSWSGCWQAWMHSVSVPQPLLKQSMSALQSVSDAHRMRTLPQESHMQLLQVSSPEYPVTLMPA